MNQNENNNEQERLQLLHEVGKKIKLTNAQVLYTPIEKLREMKTKIYGQKPQENVVKSDNFNADLRNDIDLHEELKQLSIYSYHADAMQLPQAYEMIGYVPNNNSGFGAYVVKNANGVVIVYRGTDSKRDLHEDGKMASPWIKNTEQFKDAQRLYDTVKNTPEFKNSHIILTGHSLGGSLAQYVGALNDVDTVTFNPYGVGAVIQKMADKNGQDIEIYPERIINYRRPNDILSSVNSGNNIGTTYKVDGEGNRHKIEEMGSFQKRKFDNVGRYDEAFSLHAQKNHYVV